MTTFQERINQLFRDENTSIQKFAEKCGLSRQTMQYYLSGERMPDSACLLKLCEACSVSADWLLGLSDVASLSTDMKSASLFTKLSEDAIKIIRNDFTDKEINSLCDLIAHPWFTDLLMDFDRFITNLDSLTTPEQFLETIEIFDNKEGNKVVLSNGSAVSFYEQKAGADMKDICSEIKQKRFEKLLKEYEQTKGSEDNGNS